MGLTQQELAEGIGVSQSNVSFYERGEIAPSSRVARRLIQFAKAKGLTVTFDDIYEIEPRAEADASA